MISAIAVTTVLLTTFSFPDPVDVSEAEPPNEILSTSIVWFDGSYEEVLKKSTSENKDVFIYFWTQESESCSKFQQETFGSAAAVKELQDVICFGANAVHPEGAKLVQKYNVSVLPSMIIVRPNGAVEDAILGLIGPDGFVSEMQRYKRGEGTVSALRKDAQQSPRDLEILDKLIIKLSDVGDKSGAEEIRNRIRKIDPKGKHIVAARVHLQDVVDGMYERYGEESKVGDWNLSPIYDHVKKLKNKEARFEGWNRVADLEYGAERPERGCDALMSAWKNIPDQSVSAWGYQVGSYMLELEDRFEGFEASPAVNKFGLEIAQKVVHEAVAFGDSKSKDDAKSKGIELKGDDGGEWSEYDYHSFLAERMALLAWWQFANGQTAEAVATAKKCSELQPENEKYSNLIAKFHEKKG